MAAKNTRFRAISRRLLAGAVGIFALVALAVFAGNATRSGAQSAPAQQSQPASPATQNQSPAPAQPAQKDTPAAPGQATPPQPAPDQQTTPEKAQKDADSDDDTWPDPEWLANEKKNAAAQQASQAQTPATVAPATVQPAAGAQSTPLKPQQDSGSTAPAQAATQTAAAGAPAPPRPRYTGMNPEELRKQQVADECSRLLKLATDLKSQVDKASKDELSVAVVRKAAELEQTAHKVRNGIALSSTGESAQ